MGLAEWGARTWRTCPALRPGDAGDRRVWRSSVGQLQSDGVPERRTRAIAISAHATGEYAERSLAAGFSRHVGKPYQVPDLVRTISDVLAGAA